MLNRRSFLCTAAAGGLLPAATQAGSYDELWHAIETDNATTVSWLLRRGLDPNTRDEQGQVALFVALRGGASQVIEVLLAQPSLEVDARNAANETPLMMAALRGRLDAMRRLLERGAAVHQPGWSPIHYAATGPEAKAVALLLDRGAPVDPRAPEGSTPLMMAARYGSDASAELLLARGADPTLRNAKGESAADRARGAGREALAKRLEALLRR